MGAIMRNLLRGQWLTLCATCCAAARPLRTVEDRDWRNLLRHGQAQRRPPCRTRCGSARPCAARYMMAADAAVRRRSPEDCCDG
ncbi:hypothetical protein F511_44699 [Dorcoceras hygrometricum]|uniref:Secreted protein n=1 Tax=Dorcoceras hygrometricum TaxID=472368 RepID=A0A2Z7BCN3_9LAMI|nr:hypothetical protein F511_44699 [Dorcoceras hygrometricum]